MNDFDLKPAASLQGADLSQQCARLRHQMTTQLLIMVILSGTLATCLWLQQHYAKQDRDVAKAMWSPQLQAYERQRPMAEQFVNLLREYGRTHPDFVPILNRYQISLTNPAGPAPKTPSATVSVPATTAAPKTAPAPKKQ